jgi:hypothetical protein
VLFKPRPRPAEAPAFHRLIGTQDRAGWHLYLIETSLDKPFRTEVNQAARVLPIFNRLSCARELVKEFGNSDLLATKRLGSSTDQPDSVLVEMRIGLLGVRKRLG